MPQMMPLNWLSLMIYFISIFFFMNTFIYFNFNTTSKKSSKLQYKIKKNWKW